jgi:hypothetical protein
MILSDNLELHDMPMFPCRYWVLFAAESQKHLVLAHELAFPRYVLTVGLLPCTTDVAAQCCSDAIPKQLQPRTAEPVNKCGANSLNVLFKRKKLYFSS